MRLLLLLLLSTSTLFAQRTPLKVNGTVVNNPNFTNGSTALIGQSGANISIAPTNIANAQISASAAIDASKLSGVLTPTSSVQLTNVVGLRNFVYPQQFGIRGNGVYLTNVSITASSANLTCPQGTFSASDIGKSIIVKSAGPHGVGAMYDLVTTITAVGSATSITLNNAASTTISGGNSAVAVYGTDDTAAFNVFLNYACLTNKYYTTLLLAPTNYIIAGAMDSTKQAQIYPPDLAADNYMPQIEIIGSGGSGVYNFIGSQDKQQPLGTCLWSMSTNLAAGKSCLKMVQGANTFHTTRFKIEKLSLFVPTNPQYGAIDMHKALAFSAIDCWIGDGWTLAATPVVPSNSGAYGIQMPGTSNFGGGYNDIGGCFISGFYGAVLVAEHTYASKQINLFNNYVGLHFDSAIHSSEFTRVEMSYTRYGIVALAACKTLIHSYVVEHDTGTFSSLMDIEDPNNYISGDIWPYIVQSGVGDFLTWNGGTNLVRHTAGGSEQIGRTISGIGGNPNGTDKTGGPLTLSGGQGTGTGKSGPVIVYTAPFSTTGTNINTKIERVIIAPEKTITDSATSIFEIALPVLRAANVIIEWAVEAADATDVQSYGGITVVAAVNKAGTYTKTITQSTTGLDEAKAVSSGTQTAAWSIVDGTNKITLQFTPTGSLTETTYRLHFTIKNNSRQAITLL